MPVLHEDVFVEMQFEKTHRIDAPHNTSERIRYHDDLTENLSTNRIVRLNKDPRHHQWCKMTKYTTKLIGKRLVFSFFNLIFNIFVK